MKLNRLMRMKVAHRRLKWICCEWKARRLRTRDTSDKTQRALHEVRLRDIVSRVCGQDVVEGCVASGRAGGALRTV